MIDIINYFLHLDKYLSIAISSYGMLIYVILFLIIFMETGLVVTPFLPGDSLLFAAGALATLDSLSITLLFIILGAAAVLGDSVNYSIGRIVGLKIFTSKSGIFKKEYLDKTNKFFRKYGKKTIVIARFIPIVRTFAPFVAGASMMDYSSFLTYNIIGGLSWVALFLFGGYFFGNVLFVKNNFSVVILAIISVSVIPAIIEYIVYKRN